ncbi:DinB family protein [Chitinophaga sp. Hz27]|uniref:DinB family protein n=1 Tax=Chitinophaga sp. Hz27 TaxID=3347169 RepID=UPI0035DDE348
MKEILQKYTTYNHWANNHISTVLQKLTDEQAKQELGGSFGNMRATVAHVWDAESVWLQRLQLVEKPVKPGETFDGSFADICVHWVKTSVKLEEWVKAASLARLGHVVAFTRQKNDHYKMQVEDILMHACNHSSFHRGQMVNMLRQLGVTKIPSLDFSIFSTRK